MNLEQYEYDFSEQEQPVGPGDNFWLDGKSLAIAFCRAIPERMADLLEVAMSVYASDRRSLQDYRGANTGHRRIRIRLGVRDPRFWSRREMHDRLTDYLCWLSHDPPKDYQYDVLSNGNSPNLKTVFGLEVMRSQVQKLRLHLSADDPWRELVSSYPELARAAAQIAGQDDLNIGQVSSDFVRLYRTYVYEWDSFPVTSSRAA